MKKSSLCTEMQKLLKTDNFCILQEKNASIIVEIFAIIENHKNNASRCIFHSGFVRSATRVYLKKSPVTIFNCVEVNSYMLPHRHYTCLISVTDSGRSCICHRTPAHNRWNRRMSCRLCGHSLRYCCEEVCFLLHYPYISPSLCAGYCSSNLV